MINKAAIIGALVLGAISGYAGMQYGAAQAESAKAHSGPTRTIYIYREDENYMAYLDPGVAVPGQCEDELPVAMENATEEQRPLLYGCFPVDMSEDELISFEIFEG